MKAQSPDDVLAYWFGPGMEERWFKPSADFDREVKARLGALHEKAAAGELGAWQDTREGTLALVILLDQVPRNLHRGTARAFASDAAAREVAKAALERGFDRGLSEHKRLFIYMPFEHSESLSHQELCCRLMATFSENPSYLEYAERHREIIARFGRFPHRNSLLGRKSTPEEEAFLKEPNSSF